MIKRWQISYDPAKKAKAFTDRGLNFDDAAVVFAGLTYDFPDLRFDYGEDRWITFGTLLGRMVVVVWTERSGVRHVISMRKANDREKERYGRYLD
jgi:uncharacterized protein